MNFRLNDTFPPPDIGNLRRFRSLNDFNASGATGFAPNTHFSNTFDSNQLNFDTPNNFAGTPVNGLSFGGRDANGNLFNSGIGKVDTGDTGGINGLQAAQLGIGALNTGSAIMDSYNRYKNLKLAREAFNFQKEAFNKNFGLSKASFDNQVTTVNNRINDQNAFKTAQGRADLAKLVV